MLKTVSSKYIKNKYNTYKGYDIIDDDDKKYGEIWNDGNKNGFIGNVKINNKTLNIKNGKNKKDIINKINKEMGKQVIRLTESDLHRIVENSVKRIIREKEEYVQGNLFGDDSEYGEPKGAFEKKEADKRKKKEASKKRAEARKERKANKEKDERNEFIRNHQLPFKESRNLHNIVEDSVKKIIKEIGDTPRGQEALGAVAGRAYSRLNNRNDEYGSFDDRKKLSNVKNNANDESYNNKGDMRYQGEAWKKGWKYGYNKGAEGSDSLMFK